MRETGYGRIVNIASNVDRSRARRTSPTTWPRRAASSRSPGRSPRELGKYGITVNSVAPGLTETEGVLAEPARRGVRLRADAPGDPAPRRRRRHRARGGLPRLRGGGLGHRPDARRRRRAYRTTDGERGPERSWRSRRRSVGRLLPRPLGFEVEALYDDPPYATLVLAGDRLSLAEQGHPAEDRPGVELTAPIDPTRARTCPGPRGRRRARRAWALAAAGVPSWPSRTRRRGAAAASSASTPTATWSRSSSQRELKAVVLARGATCGVSRSECSTRLPIRRSDPGDAIVAVRATAICGADLFPSTA